MLQSNHHVKQRTAAQVSVQIQLIYQAVKGIYLVIISAECSILHFLQQADKIICCSKLCAQRQCIHIESYLLFQVTVITACYRRTDHDIGLSAVAVKKSLYRLQEGDGQTGAL